MKKNHYPGMNGFEDSTADGVELLVMHRAFDELFGDENDYIPEDGELDEDKDANRKERMFE